MTLIPEDTKPDYDVAQTMIYTVRLPELDPFETADADLAERFSKNGAVVTACRGWA